MNVNALTGSPSAQAALIAAQASSGSAVPTAAQLQTDRTALAQPSSASGKPSSPKAATPGEIKKAASQFEAIIIRQLLAPSIEPVMSGGLGGAQSSGSGVYGYMLTDVLASSLSQGGGLGWARLLEKQLSSKSEGADINPSPISKPSTDTSPL